MWPLACRSVALRKPVVMSEGNCTVVDRFNFLVARWEPINVSMMEESQVYDGRILIV